MATEYPRRRGKMKRNVTLIVCLACLGLAAGLLGRYGGFGLGGGDGGGSGTPGTPGPVGIQTPPPASKPAPVTPPPVATRPKPPAGPIKVVIKEKSYYVNGKEVSLAEIVRLARQVPAGAAKPIQIVPDTTARLSAIEELTTKFKAENIPADAPTGP